ncbi:uncharacterized protein H6S33_008348 [Morchella sextelata]|uniref:uncharacterized protein n=1 Tax=Morchella sextelata TaxID=1174677 RepID=UPI001D03DB68|nr:uncharacterized protein H6S33_009839 [Morchella sextelata]XP_044687893.1 uncharacterized protein H6S33_008348 [Morchella sextelata]KAH0602295.1 hypothetical protein H6S33_009839 [Morchella sextelata]KAH0602698.1 hypothetical protein H6S33_008348 [Morchella sextelata]
MSQQYPRAPYPHASPRPSPANRNPRRWNARAPTIDLTASPPSHSDEQPAAKRRRVIESVDLTELEADEDVLRRQQREDLLKTQEAARESEKRKVAGFTCVICMEDEPTDLAVTPCGHMFCHKCLHGAIKASAMPPVKSAGRCPVCRGKVSLKDVIPMEFKFLSKREGKQKAAV